MFSRWGVIVLFVLIFIGKIASENETATTLPADAAGGPRPMPTTLNKSTSTASQAMSRTGQTVPNTSTSTARTSRSKPRSTGNVRVENTSFKTIESTSPIAAMPAYQSSVLTTSAKSPRTETLLPGTSQNSSVTMPTSNVLDTGSQRTLSHSRPSRVSNPATYRATTTTGQIEAKPLRTSNKSSTNNDKTARTVSPRPPSHSPNTAPKSNGLNTFSVPTNPPATSQDGSEETPESTYSFTITTGNASTTSAHNANTLSNSTINIKSRTSATEMTDQSSSSATAESGTEAYDDTSQEFRNTDLTTSLTDSTTSITDSTTSHTDSTNSTTDSTNSATDSTASTTESTTSTTDSTTATTDPTTSTTDPTSTTDFTTSTTVSTTATTYSTTATTDSTTNTTATDDTTTDAMTTDDTTTDNTTTDDTTTDDTTTETTTTNSTTTPTTTESPSTSTTTTATTTTATTMTATTTTEMPPIPGNSQEVEIVAGILGVLLLAGLVATAAVMYRRGKLPWNPKNSNASVRPLPIALSKFENHCNELLETHGRLGSEFQLLQALSVDIADTNTTTAAQLPDNKKKNRYTNILPYDATRVTLDVINDDPSSDYINASFVKGYSNTCEYIASQGPKEETISDFWRMVHQHDVQVIVMVTNWEEGGKPKCDHYLPKLRDQIYFGDMVVRCGTELVFPVYTQRTIVLHKGSMKRNIAHLHFNEWPDFGCPDSTDAMLQFCRTLRHQVSLYPPGIVLVHCSAGVGRTGTLIAVDILLQQIQESKKVDVFGTVFKLRKHRTNMVQTKGQYEYIYKCIRDAVKDPTFLKSDGSPASSLEPIYENVPTTLTTFLYEKVPHKVAKSNSSESECEL